MISILKWTNVVLRAIMELGIVIGFGFRDSILVTLL